MDAVIKDATGSLPWESTFKQVTSGLVCQADQGVIVQQFLKFQVLGDSSDGVSRGIRDHRKKPS